MDAVKLFAMILTTVIVVTGLYFFEANNGNIIVNRPYLQEYTQCKADLAKANALTIPPPAKCDCGSSGTTWGVMGLLYMFAGIIVFWWMWNKRNAIKNEVASLKEEKSTLVKLIAVHEESYEALRKRASKRKL